MLCTTHVSYLLLLPATLSNLLMTHSSYTSIDSMLSALIYGFVGTFICISTFTLYCDCTYTNYLLIKIVLFYISVCHLAMFLYWAYIVLAFECVGILSFRLIAHYHVRVSASRGSIIAINTNKIGDLIILTYVSRAASYPVVAIEDTFILDIMLVSISIKSVSMLAYI